MKPIVVLGIPVRYRPEAPEVFGQVVAAIKRLNWPADRIRHHVVIHGEPEATRGEVEVLVAAASLAAARVETQRLAVPADNRELGGPRWDGTILDALVFLRSRIFREWQKAPEVEACFMVDSDVVLHPEALERLTGLLERMGDEHPAEERYLKTRGTLSLMLNTSLDEGEPRTQATRFTERGPRPAQWVEDGAVVNVARAGACTLYPRSVLKAGWFHLRPGDREEHAGLFDQLSAAGFKHGLVRDPTLAQHMMPRLRYQSPRV